MKSRLDTVFLAGLSILTSLNGCSTTEVTPFPVPTPPVYTQVPHPVGMDLGDLSAIFGDEKAPQEKDFAKNCDVDFRKLEKLTKSRDEIFEGLRELVKQDPVTYHWCFYAKILELENDLKAGVYVEERQKLILDAFSFLAPLARTYASEFHDSRYLRMAITRYQKWSEWIFYRKLELTPAGTSEIVKASNPFGLWRDTLETVSVLEKYHILKGAEVAKSVETPSVAAPTSEATPSPNTAPAATPSPNTAPAATPSPNTPPAVTPSPNTAPAAIPSPNTAPAAIPSPNTPPPTTPSSHTPPEVESRTDPARVGAAVLDSPIER